MKKRIQENIDGIEVVKMIDLTIATIEPNYHEDDAIALLERWYDEWIEDGDWWGGTETWSLHVWYDEGFRVEVCGVVDNGDGTLSADSNRELDYFEFILGDKMTSLDDMAEIGGLIMDFLNKENK